MEVLKISTPSQLIPDETKSTFQTPIKLMYDDQAPFSLGQTMRFAVTSKTILCFAFKKAMKICTTRLSTNIALSILTFIPASALADWSNNANTPYPIWSELSYFERSTLGDLSKSRRNEPNALLALYLVASGSRDIADYNTATTKIQKFIKEVKKRVIDDNNQELMGEILNQEMHKNFFLEGNKDKTPLGYNADQSRLMGIFESSVFNCISSSLLYIVLANHFDLDTEGVLLANHAFIQLNIRGGQAIEIETTSVDGFNQKHDEAFYEKQNKEWFSSRQLEATTYQDYLNRNLVSPTLLGARNMLNQHTGTDQMSLKHAGRLAEISAYIEPNSPLANEKRLYFLATEIHELITQQQWTHLLRLYNTTYSRILADSAHLTNASGLQNNLQLYLSGAMLAFAKAGEIEQTLAAMGELLSRGLKAPENQLEIDNRVINAVKILLNTLSDQQRFSEGLLALTLIEGHLSNPSAWPDMLSWFYLRWAKQYWDEKNWKEVIDILDEYQNHPNPNLQHDQISKTMADTYTNWVIESVQNKDLETAKLTLERCTNFHPRACTEAITVLKKAKKEM